jgi:hypothetical protein
MVFNSNNDGLAVWETSSATGRKIVYALYDNVSGTWSADAVLRSDDEIPAYDYSMNVTAAASNNGFAVAWREDDGDYKDLYVSVYSGGSWSNATLIDDATISSVQYPVLGSNGSGYLLAWVQMVIDTNGAHQAVHTSQYNNGWSTPQTIHVPTGLQTTNQAKIASNGSGYAITWQESLYANDSVLAATYNGSWSDVTSFVGPANEDATAPEIASNGSNYMLIWKQATGISDLYHSVYNGSWSTPALVAQNAEGEITLASNGTGYAAVFVESITFSEDTLHAVIHNGSAWGSAQTVNQAGVLADKPMLSAAGSGYGLVWRQDTDIYANTYDGTWGTATAMETGTQDAQFPVIASNLGAYQILWVQFDGVSIEEVYLRSYDGTTLGTQISVLANTHDSSSYRPQVITASNGSKMVVWEQYYLDPLATTPDKLYETGLFARVYENGAWSPTHFIANEGYNANLATDGSSFLVYFRQYISGTAGMAATVYKDGAWSPVQTFSSSPTYDIAFAAGNTGYAVVWQRNLSGDWGLWSSVFDGSGWSGTVRVDDPANPHPVAYGPKMTSNGTSYALVWKQSDPASTSASEYRATVSLYESGSWSAPAQLENTAPDRIDSLAIASNGSGYAVTWKNYFIDASQGNLLVNNGIYANRHSGGSWQGPTLLDGSLTEDNRGNLSIVSNGSGYAVGIATYPNLYVTRYTGSAWSGPELMATTSYSAGGPFLASNGSGYAAIWDEADYDYTMYASVFNGTSWSATPTVIGTGGNTMKIVSNGTGYGVAWRMADDSSAIPVNYRAKFRSFDGSSWGSLLSLETGVNTVGGVEKAIDIASDGTNYNVVWTQAHAGYEDPIARKVWGEFNLP